MARRRSIAIGCRSHSGWAVVVAISGSPAAPRVLDRRRVELVDGSLPAQPYHEAAEGGLSRAAAANLIKTAERRSTARAAGALRQLLEAKEFDGAAVAGVAVVATDRSIPDRLDQILRSHLLLHAAEGDLYEEALIGGASRVGLRVERVAPGSLVVAPGLEELGRTLGPPWQKDHKLAAAAAFTLLGRRSAAG